MDQGKPKAGMRLKQYTLTVKLTEGTFSETWLAEHAYLENKEICLKIFTNPRFCQQLARRKFLTVIKDPLHLPHIEDYDPTDNFPYVAEEVVAGRSLRQLLRAQKRFSMETTFEVMKKIIQALAKMHEQNIAHMDIRPEHLILDDAGNIKVLDYFLGPVTTATLGEYYKEFTDSGVQLDKPLMRSLLYKAKRQRMGMDTGIQTDIYALGILFFELLTGTYPNRKAVFPSDVISGISSKVDQIYSDCCGRDGHMFEDCQSIVDAIQAKEDIHDTLLRLPGVRLITDDIAVATIYSLAGEKHYVDGKNIVLLSKNLENLLTTPLRYLIFDLQTIDYLNSSAIGFLINLNDRLQAKGGTAVLCNVDRKVQTILGALGFEKVVKIAASIDEAQQHLATLAPQEEKSE